MLIFCPQTEEGIYEFTEVRDKLQGFLEDIADDASAEKVSPSEEVRLSEIIMNYA